MNQDVWLFVSYPCIYTVLVLLLSHLYLAPSQELHDSNPFTLFDSCVPTSYSIAVSMSPVLAYMYMYTLIVFELVISTLYTYT